MSGTFAKVTALVAAGRTQVSRHGLNRMAERGIVLRSLIESITVAVPIEDYPDYYVGPAVLLLSVDRTGPLHSLWGIEKGTTEPAVLVMPIVRILLKGAKISGDANHEDQPYDRICA